MGARRYKLLWRRGGARNEISMCAMGCFAEVCVSGVRRTLSGVRRTLPLPEILNETLVLATSAKFAELCGGVRRTLRGRVRRTLSPTSQNFVPGFAELCLVQSPRAFPQSWRM